MPNLPLKVRIDLKDLTNLLSYYNVAVHSDDVGDLGSKSYEEVLSEVSNTSECYVSPEQLENLIYHAKQVIFEKLRPVRVDLRQKSYHKIMEKLSGDIPQLFKTLPSGEIVFINFEDRANG